MHPRIGFKFLICCAMALSLGCSQQTQSNEAFVRQYVHPNAGKSEQLDPDEVVEEASEGVVYSVGLSMEKLGLWYSTQFAVHTRDDFDSKSGRAGIHLDTFDEKRGIFVFLYDTSVPAAKEELGELLKPERLESLDDGSVVAVVFLNELAGQ